MVRSHTYDTFVLVNGHYIQDYIKHMYFDMIFLLKFITLKELMIGTAISSLGGMMYPQDQICHHMPVYHVYKYKTIYLGVV